MQNYTKAIIVGKSTIWVLSGLHTNDTLEISITKEYAACTASYFLAIDMEYVPIEGRNPISSPSRMLLQDLKHRHRGPFNLHTPVVDDSFVFTMLTFKAQSNAQVQLIITDNDPLQFVFQMRFTHDMAFVSAHHTVMLFLKSTFVNQVALDFSATATHPTTMQIPSFKNKTFIINPNITAADVLNHANDISRYP
ncbi:hypothetical protein VNI00_015274 [Paramarasmius palmivorus]|uniref:Uncharacterized protein n=1 Tax=Paramarasmius palmivorus TaxID=297713 RepID=A0AAW0BM37_9AGAR